jgi:hypothetical protein
MSTNAEIAPVEIDIVEDDRLPDEPIPANDEAAEADDAEDAAASIEEEESGDDAAADTGPKKAKGVQKRIDELTRQREDAKRERDHWRHMAMGVQPPAQQPSPGPQHDEGSAPRIEDFGNDYEAYLVARAKHEMRQDIAADQRRRAEAQERHRAIEAQQALVTRMENARAKHDDFDEVLAASNDVILADGVLRAIADSDIAGDLAYHLAKDTEARKKLATLSPFAAIRELGRIEAKLQAPPVKQPTRTPPPIKPVGGSDRAVRDPSAMSMDEYAAWRRKAS